jgi:Pyruvate/2-oxoacid:ferredoxin oxidoreductase delta subunit
MTKTQNVFLFKAVIGKNRKHRTSSSTGARDAVPEQPVGQLFMCWEMHNMNKRTYNDPFLEKRLVKYDDWLNKGQISYSSKVIPISESFNTKQWVLPTEQVIEILRKAESVAVQNCECRTHYERCDSPLEVCFLLNDVGNKLVRKGEARHVDLEEAAKILKKANESGLVHLSLYMPDHEIFALCSCCPCCCHDLQIMKHYERKDLMVRSEYVAVTSSEDCIHCGECVERCVFSARIFKDEKMEYNADACLGCGLCVTSCPVEAISMELHETETSLDGLDGGRT